MKHNFRTAFSTESLHRFARLLFKRFKTLLDATMGRFMLKGHFFPTPLGTRRVTNSVSCSLAIMFCAHAHARANFWQAYLLSSILDPSLPFFAIHRGSNFPSTFAPPPPLPIFSLRSALHGAPVASILTGSGISVHARGARLLRLLFRPPAFAILPMMDSQRDGTRRGRSGRSKRPLKS